MAEKKKTYVEDIEKSSVAHDSTIAVIIFVVVIKEIIP